jgi:hypothetical protein
MTAPESADMRFLRAATPYAPSSKIIACLESTLAATLAETPVLHLMSAALIAAPNHRSERT